MELVTRIVLDLDASTGRVVSKKLLGPTAVGIGIPFAVYDLHVRLRQHDV